MGKNIGIGMAGRSDSGGVWRKRDGISRAGHTFEEMGSACLISPILSTVLSSLLILDAGNKKQKENFLPKLARGK